MYEIHNLMYFYHRIYPASVKHDPSKAAKEGDKETPHLLAASTSSLRGSYPSLQEPISPRRRPTRAKNLPATPWYTCSRHLSSRCVRVKIYTVGFGHRVGRIITATTPH